MAGPAACDIYGVGRVLYTADHPIFNNRKSILFFCATSLGEDTEGIWFELFPSGMDAGMPKNYLDSLANPLAFAPFFTTPGAFALDDAFGGHSEVYVSLFFDEFFGPIFSAPDEGLTAKVDGLHLLVEEETCITIAGHRLNQSGLQRLGDFGPEPNCV